MSSAALGRRRGSSAVHSKGGVAQQIHSAVTRDRSFEQGADSGGANVVEVVWHGEGAGEETKSRRRRVLDHRHAHYRLTRPRAEERLAPDGTLDQPPEMGPGLGSC